MKKIILLIILIINKTQSLRKMCDGEHFVCCDVDQCIRCCPDMYHDWRVYNKYTPQSCIWWIEEFKEKNGTCYLDERRENSCVKKTTDWEEGC